MIQLMKDNSPVPVGPEDKTLELCHDIQKQINDSNKPNKPNCRLIDLLDLSEQKEDNKPPKIFQYRDGESYSTGNYVGRLEYHQDGKTKTLIISPHGPGFSGDTVLQNAQGSFFLRAMLEDCWEIPLHFLDSAVDLRHEDPYSALLAARLAAQLDRAWRRGELRFYHTFPQRDSRVRGRLDIAREIRQGMGLRDGRIACEVREYNADNHYNRLFFQACLEAERQYPNLMLHLHKLLPGYYTAFRALQGTPWGRLDTGALLDKTRKKITNPIYRDYEALRVIAHAFLRRQGVTIGETGREPFVTGIFLDLSQLWERYLLKKILPSGSERLYQSEERIIGKQMLVYPDFLWGKNRAERQNRALLDAKYKFGWGTTFSHSFWTGESIHGDVYQVLAYMLELDCGKGGVVFPVDQKEFLTLCGAESMEEFQKKRITQYRTPLGQADTGRTSPEEAAGFSFWRFPFAVPSEGKDYGAFRGAMDREARRLAGQIAQQLLGA